MLPPVVARPIRNDDFTEKIPRAMGDFFARAPDSRPRDLQYAAPTVFGVFPGGALLVTSTAGIA